MNRLSLAFATATLASLLGGAPSLYAQSFRGQLTDRDDDPIEGVKITVVRSNSDDVGFVMTDTAGLFEIELPRGGLYRIKAEKVGYRTATTSMINVGSGERRRVNLELPRERVVLDSMVVVGSRRVPVILQPFYQRLDSRSFGLFVTRDDIARTRPLLTSDLLRTLPGIQMQALNGPGIGYRLTVRGTCTPTLYIDGTRVGGTNMTIDELVTPGDIEGIEVYRAISEAPAQYQGLRAGCAAILVWTRVGRA